MEVLVRASQEIGCYVALLVSETSVNAERMTIVYIPLRIHHHFTPPINSATQVSNHDIVYIIFFVGLHVKDILRSQ